MTNDTPESMHPENDLQDSETDYRLVVFSQPEEASVLEEAFMKLPGMDRATARLQSHLMPGIVPYAYSEAAAAQVADDLTRQNIKAQAICCDQLPDLVHSQQVHHLRFTSDGLEAIDANEHVQFTAWDQIAMISVGITSSSAPLHRRASPFLAQGSSHRSWNQGTKVGHRNRPEAFLVLKDGLPGLFLASDEMNYEALGDRIHPSSVANFRELIRELIDRVPGGWATPSTLAFLEKTQALTTEFRSHEEFRRYSEFHTLCLQQVHNP
ncbi:MAG: hypothetical protein KDA91_02190 [Planctomycetaceae bacterium]|nr:hypothetical protein [Planctomycetaceae bacterium]